MFGAAAQHPHLRNLAGAIKNFAALANDVDLRRARAVFSELLSHLEAKGLKLVGIQVAKTSQHAIVVV